MPHDFIRLDIELARQSYDLGQDSRDWKVVNAQNDIKNTGPSRELIRKVLYRPFDSRYTYYTGNSRGFYSSPQREIMRHMLEENIALIMPRRVETKIPWQHCFCGEGVIEHVAVSLKTIDYVFPLFLYPDRDKKDLFNQHQTEKEANIPPALFEKLSSVYGQKPIPQDILYYIYSIFYSTIYRETYAEFLKIDFPRVPFTTDYDLFKAMGKFGKELAGLHLLKGPALDPPVAKYQGSGDNDRIEKVTFKEDEQRIYINKDKYFEGITPELWNYHIGGYQVLHKYLKDRKGRVVDDAPRYCRITTALSKTIEIQANIDKIYPKVEKELVDF